MTEASDSDYILLVEDTVTQAMLYQHSFQKKGLKTKLAKSAEKALAMIEEERPVLVLSDVNMPSMNGYELCRKLKSSLTTGNIKVILMSTVLDPEEVVEIINSGADDFLLKSMPTDYLADRLLGALKNPLEANVTDTRMITLITENGPKEVEIDSQRAANLIYSLYHSLCRMQKEG